MAVASFIEVARIYTGSFPDTFAEIGSPFCRVIEVS